MTVAPAVGAVAGARVGGQHLPLGLLEGLNAHADIEARAKAMLAREPIALRPLYDIEINLAELEGTWRVDRPPPPPAPRRSQLNLL